MNSQSVQGIDQGPSKYRWIILTLATASFLFSFVSRLTWPPLIPVVAPMFEMSNTQAGSFMTAFYIGYVITQIPAGILADRLGVKLVLTISLFLEAISTFGMQYMTSYEMGFALRVVSGLGAGAIIASCLRALTEWFPAKERVMAFGVIMAAPSAGIILSNFIVPALNNSLGWQGVFQVIGIVTAIVAILVLSFVRTSSTSVKSSGNPLGGLKVVLTNKNIVILAAAGFFLMWAQLGIATWANTYIKNIGYSVSQAGLVMIFYGIGGVLAPLSSSWVSTKLGGNLKKLLILSFVIQAPFTIVFGYLQSYVALCIVGFLIGFASFLSNSPLNVLITSNAGPQWSATAVGTANFVFQMASMMGPLVLGWSIDFTGSFSSVWWLLAAGPILGAFTLLSLGSSQATANEKVTAEKATV